MAKASANNDLPPKLGKPAERALASAGIVSLQQLATSHEQEISQLHGIGPNALVKLKEALQRAGLTFAGK